MADWQTKTSDLQELAAFARHLYRERRLRDSFLGQELFGEASWDLLLDLFAAEVEGKSVTVSSACITAQVPPTTALRVINDMYARSILVKTPVPKDKRSFYVRLTEATRADLTTLLRRMREDRQCVSPMRGLP